MDTAKLYGIIHIGSMQVSLSIISFRTATEVRTMEKVKKEVDFGEEVFQTKHLSFASIHMLSDILAGFRQLLRDYGVTEVYTIATTVLREAENQLGVVDLLEARTGFRIHIADVTEEIYYKFFAMAHTLEDPTNSAALSGHPALLLDISSGGLGLTGWHEGALLFQQNVDSGSLRLLEQFTKKQRKELTFPSALRDHIHAVLSPLWMHIARHAIQSLVLTGRDARRIAAHLAVIPSSTGQADTVSPILSVAPESFLALVDSLGGISVKRLMRRFQINETQAERMLPTLLLYDEVVRSTGVKTILFLRTTFLEGYSTYIGARLFAPDLIRKERARILGLAKRIALRYGAHLEHIEAVEHYVRILLDVLRPIHGLTEKEALLLSIAALLHETGKYINLRNYSLYTYQLVMGTDIFGIGEEDRAIIANIDYYYIRHNPAAKDTHYQALSKASRLIVSKGCAILRLADALDRGHSGKLQHLEMRLDGDTLRLTYSAEEDISLIRWSFSAAAKEFQQVFGISPIMERK